MVITIVNHSELSISIYQPSLSRVSQGGSVPGCSSASEWIDLMAGTTTTAVKTVEFCGRYGSWYNIYVAVYIYILISLIYHICYRGLYNYLIIHIYYILLSSISVIYSESG